MVSHDRWLIENSCSRFWFIQDQQLVEYHNVEEIYALIEAQNNESPENEMPNYEVSNSTKIEETAEYEDALLEQLLELEAKLEADQNRKPAHQKPQLQKMWLEEIAELQEKLRL